MRPRAAPAVSATIDGTDVKHPTAGGRWGVKSLAGVEAENFYVATQRNSKIFGLGWSTLVMMWLVLMSLPG